MEMNLPETLIKLSENCSSDIYVVGGYVRNHFAELGSTDIDICGPVIAAVMGLPRQYRVDTVNFRLGTSLIKIGSNSYEYTPFRIESYGTGGGHSPTNIKFTSDIKADAARRDFTCNSIYYNVKTGEVIDLYGGIKDIENKVVRARDPERIFADDGLRLLRLVRIACELGFKIEAKTAGVALANVNLLKDISAERKRVELDKILVADQKYGVKDAHYRGVKLLVKFGMMKYLLPQLMDGDGVEQNQEYHKYDVLEHNLMTMRYADPSIRLAALMHDIGKPYCVKMHGNMNGHEVSSEYLARQLMGPFGLRYSNDFTDEVGLLCKNHMYDLNGKTSEAKMRLFIAKNYDIIDKLIMLNEADRKGSGVREPLEGNRFETIKQQMIDEGTPLKLSDLEINGGDVLSKGIRGEKIGEVLKDIFEKCVVNPSLNNKEWLSKYVERSAKRIAAEAEAIENITG